MKILVLHGPNLNLLGEREPEIYGKLTLLQLDEELRGKARELGHELKIFQSNHEGELIDRIQLERRWMGGLILNPAALTHTSYALRDAISAVQTRAVEVHLSDIHKREPFRRVSVIKDVCEAQIAGKGPGSYLEAMELLAGPVAGKKERRLAGPAPAKKSLGRGQRAPPGAAAAKPGAATPKREGKSLGRAPVRTRSGTGGGVTRAEVAARIQDRLSGKLSLAALADWARGRYLALDRGAACAPEDHELLHDALLKLSLAGHPAGKLDDQALLELFSRLA